MAFKVVSQCSGCENPICDGDRYVHTNYGDFCENCFSIETAVYKDNDSEATLYDWFGNFQSALDKLSVYGGAKG